MYPRHTSTDRAFTLIELLVVIGILSVLLALLTPALATARRKAVQVKCAAHLRQIGMATAMYTGEWKGAVPAAEDATQRLPCFWFTQLAPYLQAPGTAAQIRDAKDRSVIWGCPAYRGSAFALDWTNVGYGYNAYPLLPNGTLGDTSMIEIGRYFKLSEIPDQSARAAVLDSVFAVVTATTWWPSIPLDPQLNYDVDFFRHGPARDWNDAGTLNALFWDGHVAAVSPSEAMYAINDPLRQLPDTHHLPPPG